MLGPPKAVGPIDEDNKPTNRAMRWRDDAQYPSVRQEIREEVYPEELLGAFLDSPIDRQALERWFANNTGVGLGAARQRASFYMLLVEADPAKQEGTSTSQTGPKPTKSSSGRTNAGNKTRQSNVPKRLATSLGTRVREESRTALQGLLCILTFRSISPLRNLHCKWRRSSLTRQSASTGTEVHER